MLHSVIITVVVVIVIVVVVVDVVVVAVLLLSFAVAVHDSMFMQLNTVRYIIHRPVLLVPSPTR